MKDIYDLRRRLHRHPELSGKETETARRVTEFFEPLGPDATLRNLGGHGVAFAFNGAEPGPTVLFRCELDALPIGGASHLCGHDGHMAILAAVGTHLSENRPHKGKVVLLYQPAEETGRGARAVMADPRFGDDIAPDYAVALHNVPGYPLGQVLIKEGAIACASRGLSISLKGSEAHAAQPETGRSPAQATAVLMQSLNALPGELAQPGERAFGTVVGARLGAKAFGTAPGRARIWATLRSETDATMARLVQYVEDLVAREARTGGLDHKIRHEDVFAATTNAGELVELVKQVAGDRALVLDRPFPWSEDFGEFSKQCPSALFGLGIGESASPLHTPGYAFPDEAIPIAARLFGGVLRKLLQ